jgi:hypothetical protein
MATPLTRSEQGSGCPPVSGFSEGGFGVGFLPDRRFLLLASSGHDVTRPAPDEMRLIGRGIGTLCGQRSRPAR